jgi:heme-degrading monooxygenase HmoA
VHARSTTVNARPDKIDDGIALVRDEVQPQMLEMDGCLGLSMIVERKSGRCIVTTSWQTPEAMRATAERVRPMRARVAETLGGGHEVEEWEIAAMHRAHHSAEGACVRATWIQVAPSRIERALDIYRLASIPAMEELEGFCSVSLLVDRETGRCVSTVTFDSLEAMQRTREQDAVIRGKGADEVQAEVLDVAEFELALAHLHVPEMA